MSNPFIDGIVTAGVVLNGLNGPIPTPGQPGQVFGPTGDVLQVPGELERRRRELNSQIGAPTPPTTSQPR